MRFRAQPELQTHSSWFVHLTTHVIAHHNFFWPLRVDQSLYNKLCFFIIFLLVQELNDNLRSAKMLQKTYLTTISWHDRLMVCCWSTMVHQLNDPLRPARNVAKTSLTTLNWYNWLIAGLLLVDHLRPAILLQNTLIILNWIFQQGLESNHSA